MITAGELRALISGKPDTQTIPLYIKYDQVTCKSIFVRTEALSTTRPEGAICNEKDPPGLYLTVSLVGSEDSDDVEQTCVVCKSIITVGDGDNWDDLCPTCADRVSTYMDRHRVDRDQAIKR